jgi:hypothetical protein
VSNVEVVVGLLVGAGKTVTTSFPLQLNKIIKQDNKYFFIYFSLLYVKPKGWLMNQPLEF